MYLLLVGLMQGSLSYPFVDQCSQVCVSWAGLCLYVDIFLLLGCVRA